MTLIVPPDLIDARDEVHTWHPVVSSHAPGFAAAVSMADRLRVVVVDLAAGQDPPGDLLAAGDRSAPAVSAGAVADRLVGAGQTRARCSSVAIADLFPDGRLDLQLRDAPPAVVLSAGTAPRLLFAPRTPGISDRLAPGEVLLLCSASFLEDPPAVLGTVRQSPADDTALARLRRALETAPHRGATASVAASLR